MWVVIPDVKFKETEDFNRKMTSDHGPSSWTYGLLLPSLRVECFHLGEEDIVIRLSVLTRDHYLARVGPMSQ